MRVAVGCDHAGYATKEHVAAFLRSAGYDVVDFGTHSAERVDYPDFAERVAMAVSEGSCGRGLLVCGTGIGVCIAANKVRGIRAAAVWSPDMARLSRLHNDANVICLSGRFQDPEEAVKLTEIWLQTPFEGERHQLRIDKVAALERKHLGTA
jgi:ribose 5-phosphate isomerase B